VLIRFGEEKIGQAATFKLSQEQPSVISGSPAVQSGVNEYNERFTENEEIKKIMAIYWKIEHTDNEKTISYDPTTKKYRAPCSKEHVALLKTAFENYRRYIQNMHDKEAPSEEKNALQVQLNRIDAYLHKLNSPGDDCIGKKETKPPPPPQTDSETLWHAVLPKIFKILYDKANAGQPEVTIDEIITEYSTLGGDIDTILKEIKEGGEFKKDHDGIRATAVSIVQLFELLKTLFPEIFNKFAGIEVPMPKLNPDEIIKNFTDKLDYLGDDEVKKCIENAIRKAVEYYNTKQFTEFWASISTAFDCFKKLIEALKAKIGGLEAEIEELRKKSSRLEEFRRIVQEISKDISKIDDISKGLATNTILSSEDKGIILAIIEAVKPNSKKCDEFIKKAVSSARKALYEEMIAHMGQMMNKMAAHVDKLQDLIKPNTLKASLEAKLDTKYIEENKLDEQKGIKEFDDGINELIRYLDILNSNYDQWIKCICKPGSTWNPETKNCKQDDCKDNEERNAEGICICKKGSSKVGEDCKLCKDVPGFALDASGNCAKCDKPNLNVNGTCTECYKVSDKHYVDHKADCVGCTQPGFEIWEKNGIRQCLVKCKDDETRDPQTGACIKNCPEPRIKQGGVCKCPYNKEYDATNNECKCPDKSKWDEQKKRCVGLQKTLDPEVQLALIRHLANVVDTYSVDETPDGKIPGYPLIDNLPPIIKENFNDSQELNDALDNINQYGNTLLSNVGTNFISILKIFKSKRIGDPLDIKKKLIHRFKELYEKEVDDHGGAERYRYRVIQLFMNLYKIASNYIDTLVCNNDITLTQEYIDSIYNTFNLVENDRGALIPSTFDNKGVFDKLFNPEQKIKALYVNRKGPPGVGGALTEFFKLFAAIDIQYSITKRDKNNKPIVTIRSQFMFFDFVKTIDWFKYRGGKDTLEYFVNETAEQNGEFIPSGKFLYQISKGTSGLSSGALALYQPRLDQWLREQAGTPHTGGSRTDLSFGPDDIPKVLAQQVAWENMNKEYNSLEPEYQQMLPEPEPAPIHSLTEPIHRFIDDFAEEGSLEEARGMLGLLSPHEVDDLMTNDNGTMDRMKPLYKNALPSAKDEWIPILVRADVLRTLL
jgi:hypothetical protein